MENYHLVKEIGKGAFGTAYIVKHKASGERFVLKKVRLARQSIKERQGSLCELRLLSSLKHRNIVGCREAWVEGGCVVCLVLEFCESGDLATQLSLRQPDNYFPEQHLQEMLVQLASSLAYIHRNGIAHRDIKGCNVLITSTGRLLLADFGLAAVMGERGATSRTMVGTPGYMAPQLLTKHVQYDTYKNDIWGLGCVLYEASALKPAFAAFNMAGLVKKVTGGGPPTLPSHYSDEWQCVIRSMLVKEEDKRPSAEEILDLPWLQDAKQRVLNRFGPELPPGTHPNDFQLLDLPYDVQQLADQLKQQQEEADERQRVNAERRKALQFVAGLKTQGQASAPAIVRSASSKAPTSAATGHGATVRPTAATRPQSATRGVPASRQASAPRPSVAAEHGTSDGGTAPRPHRPGSAPSPALRASTTRPASSSGAQAAKTPAATTAFHQAGPRSFIPTVTTTPTTKPTAASTSQGGALKSVISAPEPTAAQPPQLSLRLSQAAGLRSCISAMPKTGGYATQAPVKGTRGTSGGGILGRQESKGVVRLRGQQAGRSSAKGEPG